jgi:uncharacterized membrane protein
MPWKDKTGLAKAAAILTTTLSIATASCGVNYVFLVASLNEGGGSWGGNWLLATGWIELAVMAGSLTGLVLVFVLWIVAKLRRKGRDEAGDTQ